MYVHTYTYNIVANSPIFCVYLIPLHQIIQISGFIKCVDSASNSQEHLKSLGLIAICCPMESMSIANLAFERSSFTETTTLDLIFTRVESRCERDNVHVQ